MLRINKILCAALIMVMVATSGYADAYSNLKVRTEELDGDPSIYPTRKLVFDNGAVTDLGGNNVRVTADTDVITAKYVPYTGATADLDLGAYDFSATDGDFSGDLTVGGHLSINTQWPRDLATGFIDARDTSTSAYFKVYNGASSYHQGLPVFTFKASGLPSFGGSMNAITSVADDQYFAVEL